MIRNAKVLALALVAMLAMSAVVVSAASAAAFDAPSGNKDNKTRVTAKQEANFEHKFTVTHGAVSCEGALFTGDEFGTGLATIEVAPEYTNCLFAGVSAVVDPNGCKYKLGATGSVDIVCPAGNEITVTAPPAPTTAKCTVHVPPQTGLATVGYTPVGAVSPTKEVTVTVNISGIKYSQTEGSGLGKCATADNHTNGTYAGKALATGETTSGSAHTDIIWTA